MKRYTLPYLTREQRKLLETILLEEMELQAWFSIVVFGSSRTEVFICLQ